MYSHHMKALIYSTSYLGLSNAKLFVFQFLCNLEYLDLRMYVREHIICRAVGYMVVVGCFVFQFFRLDKNSTFVHQIIVNTLPFVMQSTKAASCKKCIMCFFCQTANKIVGISLVV